MEQTRIDRFMETASKQRIEELALDFPDDCPATPLHQFEGWMSGLSDLVYDLTYPVFLFVVALALGVYWGLHDAFVEIKARSW